MMRLAQEGEDEAAAEIAEMEKKLRERHYTQATSEGDAAMVVEECQAKLREAETAKKVPRAALHPAEPRGVA